MVKFINSFTGTVMWVHESRMDEYIAAGHKLAAAPAPSEKPKAAPRKTTAKKTTK